jgi:multiple sugar transport system permease protein
MKQTAIPSPAKQAPPLRLPIGEAISRAIDRHAGVGKTTPAVLVLLVLYLIPVISVVVLSFYQWTFSRVTAPAFIGLGNYVTLFTEERFWTAVFNTTYYAALALVVQIPLGMIIALVFNMQFIGRGIIRTIFLFPMMATPLASMIAWKMMLDANTGVPQLVTRFLGITPVAILTSGKFLIPALVLVDTWQWTPFVTLILLAGLAALPTEPYESARIDGASEWQLFWSITVPLMRWAIAVAALFRMIDVLKVFETIFILAPGGTWGTTKGGGESLNLYTYRESLEYFHIGYGSALVVVFFFIIFGLSLVILRLRRGST